MTAGDWFLVCCAVALVAFYLGLAMAFHIQRKDHRDLYREGQADAQDEGYWEGYRHGLSAAKDCGERLEELRVENVDLEKRLEASELQRYIDNPDYRRLP